MKAIQTTKVSRLGLVKRIGEYSPVPYIGLVVTQSGEHGVQFLGELLGFNPKSKTFKCADGIVSVDVNALPDCLTVQEGVRQTANIRETLKTQAETIQLLSDENAMLKHELTSHGKVEEKPMFIF